MVVVADVPEVGGLGLMQYDEDVTMGKYEAALDAARGTTKLESVSLWARMKYVNELQSRFRLSNDE